MSWQLEVDPVCSSSVTGRLRRAGGDEPLRPAEVWIDGAFEAEFRFDAADPEPIEFRIPLPRLCFDGQPHTVTVRFQNQREERPFQSRYDGFVDAFSDNLLTGWVTDGGRPGVPVDLEIDLNGETVGRATADVYRETPEGRNGFCHKLQETAQMGRSFVVRVRVAGTDIDLQKSPVLSLSRPRVVKAAQQLNLAFHYLEERLLWKRGGRGPELNSSYRLSEAERRTFADLLLENCDAADLVAVRHRFLRSMQAELTGHYARRDYVNLGQDYPGSHPRRNRTAHRDRPVDVIVPLYAGLRESERCLESVVRAPAGCRYELVCVLDNPDDAAMASLAERFAARHEQFTLLRNSSTQGFAHSVNRAMDLHRDRDVCILQADCEVHGDWLLRLQDAAYRGAGAGMVNPLTDQAEFLNYPAAGIPLPPDAPFEVLDELARKHSRHRTVATPAAMGFCLFVRRGCLDDLGFFHNDQASGGYFAEKYFSVNAAAGGWRSVIAADVFVRHHGFVSFAHRDWEAVERARDQFLLWCTFYADTVTDFLVDDPALAARRELDIARLEAVEQDNFCFIAHGSGGGTERHLLDLSEALAVDGMGALMLFALPERRVYLASRQLENIESTLYWIDGEWELLVRDLKRLRVRHIHIHSNVEVPRELFRLPRELNLPYDITVHDYAWFCPRVSLVNLSGEYCGEPPVAVCEACSGVDVAALRETSGTDLTEARRVFCPSEDARRRIVRHFGITNTEVRPHPERIPEPEWEPDEGEPVTVAIIGRLSAHKGLRVFRQVAAYALEWALPLRLVVFGDVADEAPFGRLTNVEVTGAYREGEIDELLERQNARVALLPSIWPETYSYTLSIALRNGLVPVAFDLGAIAERVLHSGGGILLAPGTPTAKICEALLQAGHQTATQTRRRRAPLSRGYLNMMRDYYGLPDSR